MYRAILIIVMMFCAHANAAFINGTHYLNNASQNYWTNLDLNLDILRLNWVDTLGGQQTEQKSLADYQSFISSTTDGWRFATWNEFTSIYTWFDTDSQYNGWSQAQNTGTNLFFDLNGFGPAFEVQSHFNNVGYTYWQFGTLNPNYPNNSYNPMSYIWFADFGDQVDGVDCPAWSVLCRSGYITNYSGLSTELHDDNPMWTAVGAIGMQNINVAPLLVRQTSSHPAPIDEPSAYSLFLVTVLSFLLSRKVVKNKRKL